jgi:hypothetical protein
MSKSNVIRAWKDPAYRSSLSQAERCVSIKMRHTA